jgi:hypothetical protein
MKSSPPGIRWYFHFCFVLMGTLMILLGWAGLAEGYRWLFLYSARAGQFVHAPMLGFAIMGCFLILLGLFPWRSLERSAKRPKF